MRAGLVTGHRRFELVEFPVPEPAPGAAVVAVAACGVCGTDVHGYLGHAPYNPAICGHEWVGTISRVGAGVPAQREGERVVIGVAPPCGRCGACRAGQGAWCQTAFLGAVGRDPLAPPHGGFAPEIAMDAQRLIPAGPRLSDVQAAMIEPVTVCLHAMRRTPVRASDTCVVIGAGPIGLLTLQLARLAGAGRTLVSEPNPARRALAARLGATWTGGPDAVGAAVSEMTGGLGADVVFECAGVPATIQAAADLARRGGLVSLVGFTTDAATITPSAWLMKELTVVASLAYLHHEFHQAIDLVADGRLALEPLHSGTIGLTELPAAMARLADDPTSAVKLLVDPTR